MFQNRRQAAVGNISLGTLSAAPSYQDMSFLQEQAAKYRGRFVEVGWTVPKTGVTFQLTAKFVPHQAQPTWMLYRNGGSGSELVWGHTSNDLTLMHNLLMLECEKADGSNSISAGSMDAVMSVNNEVGSVMGGAFQTQAAHRRTTTTQTTPVAMSNTVLDASKPAATWLQNLQTPRSPAGQPTVEIAKPATTTGAQEREPDWAEPLVAETLLDGNLSNIAVPKLLRYLSRNGLTGRLSLQSSLGAAEIFVKAGQITHAATLDSKGEHGLLDVATWQDGNFNFSADDQTAQQTLAMETREMLIACDAMLEYSLFLQQAQLRTNSYLLRTKELNRAQFDQQVRTVAVSDIHQLWRVYDLIDGNHCLSDLLRLCPMTRGEWIPAMFALIKSETVSVSQRPAETRPGMFLEGAPIDQNLIDTFLKALNDPADQLMRRAAFLYLLQQEHFRHERTGAQYALALFSFASTNLLDGNITPFTTEMMKETAARIGQAKRKLDIVGHFDSSDCALLLPETDSAGAAVFCNRVVQVLKKPPLAPELEKDQVIVASFGIASVPHDVRDLPALIAAARAAKSRSKMMGAPICLYSDS